MALFHCPSSQSVCVAPIFFGDHQIGYAPLFLDFSLKYFSMKYLHNALEGYIPPNVWDRIAGVDPGFEDICGATVEQYLRPVFDSFASDMKRYGSIQELVHDLEVYVTFPGAHQALNCDRWDPYCTYPLLYNSYSNPCENYVAKQDLLVLLQNQLAAGFSKVSGLSGDVSFTVFAAYLKFHEEKLEHHCEFVKLPDKFCATVEAETKKQVARYLSPTSKAHKYTHEAFLNNIKSLIPDWNDTKHSGILCILKEMPELLPHEQLVSAYENLLNTVRMLTHVSNTIITSHPTLFLPNSYTPNVKHPVILRLFQDGSRQFVMIDELKSVVPGLPLDKLLLETVDFEEASRLLRDVDDVQFIITVIVRAKHCAQPIRDPYGKYCKLAVDHLFELLQDLIFGLRLFQRIRKEHWSRVVELFLQYSCQFDAKKTNMYFIRKPEGFLDCEQLEKHFFGCLERPAKCVRNAKADGFTVQNLKNELKYLGLVEVFPDITDYAEVVYEHVSKVKKEPVLRTCDLFDAVEHCQLICFFKKMPELTRFLHNQSDCNRALVTDRCSERTEKPSGDAVKESVKELVEKPVKGFLQLFKTQFKETVKEPEAEPEKSAETSSKNFKKPVEDPMENTEEKLDKNRVKESAGKSVETSLKDLKNPVDDLTEKTEKKSDKVPAQKPAAKPADSSDKEVARQIVTDPVSNEIQRRSRFAESQWNTIQLSDVKVQKVKNDPHLDRERFIMDRKLICVNGLELLNSDTAIQILLNKCFPEDPEKRIQIAEKVLSRDTCEPFILGRKELDELISAVAFQTDPEIVLNACKMLENLQEFSKRRKRKTIYFRFYARILWESAKTLLDMIPILLKQQGDRVDYDKLDACCAEKLSQSALWTQFMSLNVMEKILDEFEVDKSMITLVPEIGSVVLDEERWTEDKKCQKLTYEQLEKKLVEVEAELAEREEQHWITTREMNEKLAVLEEQKKKWEQQEIKKKIPEPRKSATCKKCLRTSTMCTAAKKEAASLQSQVKKLEKSLVAAQRNLKEREELDERRAENCARAEEEVVTSKNNEKNLQKKLTVVERELEDLKARKKVIFPEHKESANCEKCFRTSAMCTEAKKEAATRQNQVERLKKSLTAAEKGFKERQLEEEKRNTDNVNRLTEELNLVKKELDEQKESCKSAEGSALRLLFEKVELAKSNSDKDRIIRLLKVQIPKETLRTLEIEKTAELKRVFVDLVEKSNELKSSSSLGNAMKQMHTFISMNDDPMVRKRVEFEMLQFRVNFQNYSTAIEQNIKIITEDALITREELIPLPDPPSLSNVILEEFQKAQDAKNQEIDQECMICMKQLRKKKKDTHQCCGCKKKFHVDCVRDWWIRKDTTECPHCKIDICDN